MGNPTFVDEKIIGMVHQDEDYDDYNTPNNIKIDETSYMEPDATEPTSPLRLRQNVKRDKLTVLYRHLNVTGDINLIDLDRFRLTTDQKKGATIFEFYNNDRWVPLILIWVGWGDFTPSWFSLNNSKTVEAVTLTLHHSVTFY